MKRVSPKQEVIRHILGAIDRNSPYTKQSGLVEHLAGQLHQMNYPAVSALQTILLTYQYRKKELPEIFNEVIASLEGCLSFYVQNDDGTGEPFMAMGFPREAVRVFRRAAQVLEEAKRIQRGDT